MRLAPFATLLLTLKGFTIMRVTTEEVRHMAVLARVGMTEEEIETMRDQMSDILEHFDVLQQVDTEDVDPTGHSANIQRVMRDDEVSPSRPIEDVLANVPQREGDYVRIRAVLE